MALDHFGFAKLVVADLEKSAAFYKQVFQLTERGRVESAIEGRAISEIMYNPTAPGAATFVLLSYPDAPKPVRGELILGFISQDLRALVDRARSAGGAIVQDIQNRPEHGVKVAFVRDLEGHLIEVVEPL